MHPYNIQSKFAFSPSYFDVETLAEWQTEKILAVLNYPYLKTQPDDCFSAHSLSFISSHYQIIKVFMLPPKVKHLFECPEIKRN